MKARIFGKDGSKDIDIKLSPEAQKELDEIKSQVEKKLKPLYDSLGVDMETEELHWTNNQVYIINKKTRQRREIGGATQRELNNIMMNDAINMAKEMKR